MTWLAGRNAVIVGEGKGVEAVGKGIKEAGANIFHSEFCDDLESAKSALEIIDKQAGGIHILIHGGRLPKDIPCEELTLKDWREDMKNNLDSRFFYSSALANSVIGSDQHACILYLDFGTGSDNSSLSSSEGAMSSLTKTLAVEWARDGVRVNSIVSKTVYHGNEKELGSLGKLASYLCSDFAAYVTGASVGIAD